MKAGVFELLFSALKTTAWQASRCVKYLNHLKNKTFQIDPEGAINIIIAIDPSQFLNLL